MGEVADDILDGTLCQECGVYLGEGDGYPRSCAGCVGESSVDTAAIKRMEKQAKRAHAHAGYWRVLRDAGVTIVELSEYHWRLPQYGIDLWPSTGKYKKTKASGKAAKLSSPRELLEFLQKRHDSVAYLTDLILLINRKPQEVDVSHIVAVLGRARKQIVELQNG